MTAPNENPEVEETEVEETEEQESTEDTPSLEDVLKERDELKKALDKANKERARLGRKIKEEPKETPEVPELSDRAKRVLVTTALRAEGLNETQAKRLAKLYDLNDLELDENDEVIGLDFDDLKDEFPELFNKNSGSTGSKPSPGRKIDKGDKRNTGQADPKESFANALLRK